MSRLSTDYLRQLLSLLPRGGAWSREPGTINYELMHGISDELARVDNRSQDLLIERDTQYTDELIEEHEADLDLPEGCVVDGIPFDPVLSLSERRLATNAKLIASGQQSKEYFIDFAEAYGFSSSIDEFDPAFCGLFVAGDSCGDVENLFYWRFNVNYTGDIIYFITGESAAGESLQKVTDLLELIFCYAEAYKPAHTVMIHRIVGPEYDAAFSDAFHSFASGVSSESDVYGNFHRGFSAAFSVFEGGEFDYDAFSLAYMRLL